MSLSAPPVTAPADTSQEDNAVQVSSMAQILDAVMNTAAHPDLLTIMSDVALVLNLVHKVKQANGGLHPTAVQVLKSIL